MWKKILIVFVSLAIFGALLIGLFVYVIYLDYLKDNDLIFSRLHDFTYVLDNERETDNAPVDGVKGKVPTVVYDRAHRIITKYDDEKYKLWPVDEMPFYLTRGFVHIEDRAFYFHNGVNYKSIFISLLRNVVTFGRSGGGSTISQQLSKILFTKQERSIKRKIYELFCTFELESVFSKNEILKIYLNMIYMGHGTYGIANASAFYFNKSPAELTIAESALLIGMNRSPERYSPIRNQNNARHIQKVVLNSFVAHGWLSQDDAEAEISRFWDEFDARGNMGNQSIWKTDINNSGYLTEYVRQVLASEFPYERVTHGGLIVETTFDLERQNIAEETLKSQLRVIRANVAERSEKTGVNYSDAVINAIEGSFVSMDYRSGGVLVLVGGSGFTYGNQINRANRSYRQVGSVIKPFIYAKALESASFSSLQPFSKVKDELVTYVINKNPYTPKNFNPSHVYGNYVTLYDALRTSLNTVAVALMNDLDIQETADFIRTATILNQKNERIPEVLSLALGVAELSALELARGYAIFGRNGRSVKPYAITKVYDQSGNVYFDISRPTNPYFNHLSVEKNNQGDEIVRPEIAYEVLQMMKGVFEVGGTGYWAAQRAGLRKMAYGKSGTTQEFKDGWFAGLTESEVSVAWIGNDNSMSLLATGEGVAANLWAFYNQKVSSMGEASIEVPKGMKYRFVDRTTGLLANAHCPDRYGFYFDDKSAMPEPCYVHGEALPLIIE